jgi:hypothetical protein
VRFCTLHVCAQEASAYTELWLDGVQIVDSHSNSVGAAKLTAGKLHVIECKHSHSVGDASIQVN